MKKRAKIPDDNEPVEFRDRRSAAWALAIVYGVMGLVCLWAATLGFAALTESDLAGDRLEQAIFSPFGRLGMTLLALWLGALAAGPLWRLRDGRPMFTADAKGIMFHPSIHKGAMAWSDVERIEITSGRGSKLAFRLKRRFWSLHAPQTSRSVELSWGSSLLSYRETEAMMRRMRRWAREARDR